MRDGGMVMLEWSHQHEHLPEAPVLIVLPGIGTRLSANIPNVLLPSNLVQLSSISREHSTCGAAGHSQERYVRRMVAEMVKCGWVAVVYNRRGHKEVMSPESEGEPDEGKEGTMSLLYSGASSPDHESNVNIMTAAKQHIVRSFSGLEEDAALVPTCLRHHRKRVWPMYSDMQDMHEVSGCGI
jgi:hypothetical protein